MVFFLSLNISPSVWHTYFEMLSKVVIHVDYKLNIDVSGFVFFLGLYVPSRNEISFVCSWLKLLRFFFVFSEGTFLVYQTFPSSIGVRNHLWSSHIGANVRSYALSLCFFAEIFKRTMMIRGFSCLWQTTESSVLCMFALSLCWCFEKGIHNRTCIVHGQFVNTKKKSQHMALILLSTLVWWSFISLLETALYSKHKRNSDN